MQQAIDPNRRGFRINQLFSYTVSPAEVTQEYLKAQTNSFALQEFTRSVLGEPFVEESSQITEAMIIRAKEAGGGYRCKELAAQPGETRMITMGIDRGAICYYTVCEWFYKSDAIDLNESAHCRVLDAGIFSEEDFIMYSGRLMKEWQVRGCMVDADPGVPQAKRFAREFPGFVWLNRYREGRTGKSMSIEDDKSYAPIATVDRTCWLDLSLGRFFRERVELPIDIPVSFGQHLMNEVRMYKEDKFGNPYAMYDNYGKPNHFAHSFNYAETVLPLAASAAAGCDVNRFL